ncbi:MAG: DUF3631 domain-containing protein [Planctomycetales bacterium]|nr:DUF3631 domain-containing protein [Planctomycetales bacterium]
MASITVGTGLRHPQGRRVEWDGSPAALAAILAGHAGSEAWWSPGMFRDDYRCGAGWSGSSVIGVDLDYVDGEGKHAALPEEVRRKLRDAIRLYTVYAGLAHSTPRGARVVFVLTAEETDPARWRRAAEGASAMVAVTLERAGLLAGAESDKTLRAGLAVDLAASRDLARAYWTPRATVGGEVRRGRCVLVHPHNPSPCPIEALLSHAPPERVRQASASPPPTAPVGNGRESAYVAAAVAGEVERVRGAPPGARNNTLNASAFALGGFVGGGLLARDRAEEALLAAAPIAADFPESEARAAIESGLSAGAREPRGLPEGDTMPTPPTVHKTQAVPAEPRPAPALPAPPEPVPSGAAGAAAPELVQSGGSPAVDGAALLDSIVALVRRYIVLPAVASDALALWVLGAHGFDAWECYPSLGLTSPTRRCAKTRTLTVLAALVPKPLHAANATTATIFRAIEKWRPTLLLDEAENILSKRDADPELRAVLNAGHTRAGAVVLRCAPKTHEVQRFSAWCPRAYALIGDLPGTLRDRSVVLSLRRRRASDPAVPRMRERELEAKAEPLRTLAAHWAAENVATLRAAAPAVPSSLDDRAADGWASLLAVADQAGGDWPGRARAAAEMLSADRAEDEADSDAGLEALRDMAGVFGAASSLPSTTITERLNADTEGAWKSWHGGKGVTPRDLARFVRPFGVRPRTVRLPDGSTPKGYHAADLADALSPYTPSTPPKNPPHPPHEELPPTSPRKTDTSTSATTPLVADTRNLVNATQSPSGRIVADVAAKKGGGRGEADGTCCRSCGGTGTMPRSLARCPVCRPAAPAGGGA